MIQKSRFQSDRTATASVYTLPQPTAFLASLPARDEHRRERSD
ncbi:hypothetical protein [Haladaptatus cibarius]|nr:hypothetical protein [Haladaptatus cibarius]